MKVLVTDYAWNDLEIERKMLEDLGVTLVAAASGGEDELVMLAAEADGIFTNWKRVTKRVIAGSNKCQAIVRYGVGLDNIDVQYATEMGILVANVPKYCVEEVSDHTMALLLALARKLTLYDRATKADTYNLKMGTPLYRIRGKTLGIVGFGKIGQMVSRKARGFGLHVITYSHRIDPLIAEEEKIEIVGFQKLLRHSDFISIHVPLMPETRHLIDSEALQQMKKTAFLINTARGDIIDTNALLTALDEGRIAGAALDVLPKEPPNPGDPLLKHPKTIVTPHTAFNSEESLEELRGTASSEMRDVFSGKIPKFLVNPRVLENSNLRVKLSGGLG